MTFETSLDDASENDICEMLAILLRPKKELLYRWFHHDFDDDDAKFWDFLEHRGPLFAPPYTPLPSGVQFCYDGNPMQLSLEAEEMASFYAKILDTTYVKVDVFNDNFFGDWRHVSTCSVVPVNFLQNAHKRHPIARPLGRDMGCFCGFTPWFTFYISQCNNMYNIMLS